MLQWSWTLLYFLTSNFLFEVCEVNVIVCCRIHGFCFLMKPQGITWHVLVFVVVVYDDTLCSGSYDPEHTFNLAVGKWQNTQKLYSNALSSFSLMSPSPGYPLHSPFPLLSAPSVSSLSLPTAFSLLLSISPESAPAFSTCVPVTPNSLFLLVNSLQFTRMDTPQISRLSKLKFLSSFSGI